MVKIDDYFEVSGRVGGVSFCANRVRREVMFCFSAFAEFILLFSCLCNQSVASLSSLSYRNIRIRWLEWF